MSNYVSKNKPLSSEETLINAKYIKDYLSKKGWTLQAICGLMGNMQAESRINPGAWQGYKENLKLGYGLVQWTPATKYFEWADAAKLERSNIKSQLDRILFELAQGLQFYSSSAYKMTFKEYVKSTETPEKLAYVFLNNYERPGDRNQPHRQTYARAWYSYFSEQAEKSGIVSGDNVNLRAGADMNSIVLGQLQKGTNVKVLGESGSFVKVEVTCKVVAFVHENYIK